MSVKKRLRIDGKSVMQPVIRDPHYSGAGSDHGLQSRRGKATRRFRSWYRKPPGLTLKRSVGLPSNQRHQFDCRGPWPCVRFRMVPDQASQPCHRVVIDDRSRLPGRFFGRFATSATSELYARSVNCLTLSPARAPTRLRPSTPNFSGAKLMSKPTTLYDKIWNDHLVTRPMMAPACSTSDRHLVHEVDLAAGFEACAPRPQGAMRRRRRSPSSTTTSRPTDRSKRTPILKASSRCG